MVMDSTPLTTQAANETEPCHDCAQGARKPRGSSEDRDELEGASDGEVGVDLDDCEDHEEDLDMNAATGALPPTL